MKKYFVFFCVFVVMSAYAELSGAKFPGTIDDMSFKSRMEIAYDGYKPLLDKKAYQELEIVPGEEIFIDHMILEAEAEAKQQEQDAKSMNIGEYCEKYPYDEQQCPQNSTTNAQYSYTNTGHCITDWTIGRKPVIPGPTVTGGACYPPNHAGKGRENRILTSGRYETISPAFEKAMITILRKEGGCGTIKADSGGYTCLGIAWNYNKDKFPTKEALSKITYAQAEDYYYNYFWLKYKIYKLPDTISGYYLLAAMGSGPSIAYNQFRKFLNVKNYNRAYQIDDEMVGAARNYNGNIAKDWIDKVREPFLHKIEQAYAEQGSKINYAYSIKLQRENGCHICPTYPLHRPPQPIQRKIN